MSRSGSSQQKYTVVKLNQPDGAQPVRAGRPKWAVPIAVALLLVGIVGISVWLTSGDVPPSEPDAPARKHKVERTEAASLEPVIPIPAPEPTPPVRRAKKDRFPPKPAFMDSKPRSEWTSAETAKAYQWYALDPNNRIQGVDMTTRIPPPVFSNVVQECMAPYLIPGADVVPMGPITDEQAREAIRTPIEFGEDDSEELLAKKQGVREMLAELGEYMDQGGHARDYFLQLESRQALESESMQLVRDKVREMEREGNYDGAVEALNVFNEYLEEKGLPKVHMRIRQKGY